MASTNLPELLKLPAAERADLAIALWDSLSDAQRDEELLLTPEQTAELSRRWAQHLANPGSAEPWEDVRRRLWGTD